MDVDKTVRVARRAVASMFERLIRKSATLLGHPASTIKTRIFLPLCQRLGKPGNYQRCGFVCKQPWNGEFVEHYRRARNLRRNVDPESMDVIRILSYSRSGSHNLFSRLHYLPSCFVLKENLSADKSSDPMWLSLSPDDITALDYMGFSLFGLHGVQQKHGECLKHLVTPFNKLLEYPLEDQVNPFPPTDRVVFLVRNFFRVLMSRQNAVQAQGKNKWQVTDERFYAAIDAHHANTESYAGLMAQDPRRFLLIGHEVFCARPKEVFEETTEKLGIGDGEWKEPEEFFIQCLDGRTRPMVENGALWDVAAGEAIMGTGGKYNPKTRPSLDRTLKDDVSGFVKKEWVGYAETLFGRDLVDMWMSDTPATYESMTNGEYARLLCGH